MLPSLSTGTESTLISILIYYLCPSLFSEKHCLLSCSRARLECECTIPFKKVYWRFSWCAFIQAVRGQGFPQYCTYRWFCNAMWALTISPRSSFRATTAFNPPAISTILKYLFLMVFIDNPIFWHIVRLLILISVKCFPFSCWTSQYSLYL